jgi:hypothetical protein
MRGTILKKEIIFGIIILMISTSFMPVLAGNDTKSTTEKNITSTLVLIPEKTTTITFYVFEKTKLEKHTIIISIQDATTINTRFQELKKELTTRLYNELTKQHVQQFINLLEEKHALPIGISTQELNALLEPPTRIAHRFGNGILPFQSTSSEWFCNFATTGTGSAFPIIILPRFIPFILTPIPRIFVKWSTPDGITSVGGLRSGTGFIATGNQKGLALGFWGIGFSIFLPPISQYGIFGYALFARVTADSMEFWPPNNPPEITQTDPADGQTMVPLSTKELRFSIYDADKKDLMSYTVTTDPDIGSGSGGLKPNGVYSIPISGLESLTNYSWHISVTDGKDTTEKTLKFTTAPTAPVVSNPTPANGEREVSPDITHLQFLLKDYQGDALEFTVQTSPNIGSDYRTGVYNGTYSVTVSGAVPGTAYRWFVNVTDGNEWTRKVFSFETGYPSPFDPFANGWHYRKQVTLNHTQVADDLEDFTVLLSTTDPDLMKAQASGNDILFMNDVGAAVKLHHEIESFDASTGTLIAWVNIPLLSSSQDTVFYLYYGNPNSINQSYPQKTWNSNYKGVWHLNNDPTGKILDSTINGNYGLSHGGMTHSDLIDGKTGKCLNFDGSDDFISLSSALVGQSGSIEAWIYANTGGEYRCILTKGQSYSQNSYFMFCVQGNGAGLYSRAVESGSANVVRGDTNVLSSWHHVVGISDGATWSLYVDGHLESLTVISGSNDGEWFNGFSGDTYSIGALNRPTYRGCFDGYIDEVRLSSAIESQEWISALYHNQNDPSSFSTFGPEVPGP